MNGIKNAIVILLYILNVYSQECSEFSVKIIPIDVIDIINTKLSIKELLSNITTPVIFKNSLISTWPKYSPSEVLSFIPNGHRIEGVFKHEKNQYFGPQYDKQKPFAQSSLINEVNFYTDNFSLSKDQFLSIFPDILTPKQTTPPYYAFATDISTFPSIDNLINYSQLIEMMPTRSSINLWISQQDGTTPCHYDGYTNLYAQLYGEKKFLLFSPHYSITNNYNLKSFPFLHPSYGQCQLNLTEFLISSFSTQNENCENNNSNSIELYEVILKSNDLLYLPPFWLHQVTAMTTSVSINVWTDISETELFQKV